MTCVTCKHEFCWTCLGSWKEHGSASGGYYKCNKFDELQNTDSFKKEAQKVENAKHELQRYMFYYERYDNHRKAEKHAKDLLPKIEEKIELLHSIKQYPAQELQFLRDACLTVM
jgi:ariadne-1